MTLGHVVALALAGLSVGYVLAPLFRKDATATEKVLRHLGEGAELSSRREMLLSSLRDLEDDHATGKIDETDYAALKDRLTAETAEVLNRLDAIQAGKREGKLRSHPSALS